MNKIKSLLSIVLIFALMLTLAGCGEVKKAETTVNGMFAAFKNADLDVASKYVNVDEINASDEKPDGISTKTIMKTIFNKLDYKILSSEKIDDNTVKVKTKITITDMKPVIGDFFAKVMQYAFSTAMSDPQPSDEESAKKAEEMFIECASKDGLATVSNVVNIKVVKNKDGKWKVESDDKFANALLGGLPDAAKEISNQFNSED